MSDPSDDSPLSRYLVQRDLADGKAAPLLRCGGCDGPSPRAGICVGCATELAKVAARTHRHHSGVQHLRIFVEVAILAPLIIFILPVAIAAAALFAVAEGATTLHRRVGRELMDELIWGKDLQAWDPGPAATTSFEQLGLTDLDDKQAANVPSHHAGLHDTVDALRALQEPLETAASAAFSAIYRPFSHPLAAPAAEASHNPVSGKLATWRHDVQTVAAAMIAKSAAFGPAVPVDARRVRQLDVMGVPASDMTCAMADILVAYGRAHWREMTHDSTSAIPGIVRQITGLGDRRLAADRRAAARAGDHLTERRLRRVESL